MDVRGVPPVVLPAAPAPRLRHRRGRAAGPSLLLAVLLAACGGAEGQAPPVSSLDETAAPAVGDPAAQSDGDEREAEGEAPVAAVEGEAAERTAGAGPPATARDDQGAAPEDGAAALDEVRLTRLTEPGCCTQPWWGPTGDALYFIDRPAPDAPTGIWSVHLDAPGAPPELLTDPVAYYSDDMAYRFELEAQTTALVRRADGQRWEVPAGGRPVSISPSGDWVLWQVSNPDLAFERRVTQVWIARLDGSEAREVARLARGSVSAWIDDQRLLVRGRDDLQADEDVLWVMQVADGSLREIARAERLRGELVSPGGSRVAWYVARQEDPAQTGIWLLDIEGGAAPRRIDKALFGAYQWRDDDRLLLVPQRREAGSHRLYELDAAGLEARPLTDPAVTPFTIANGDWAVAPDGRHVAFVESRDKAIWVLALPGAEPSR